jgi:hypothetical protein
MKLADEPISTYFFTLDTTRYFGEFKRICERSTSRECVSVLKG